MADGMDNVKREVQETAGKLRDAYTFKPQREAAGRAIDRAKKTVSDTVSRYTDKARKAMSSSKSSGRKSSSR